jgi:hypothetical protein
MELVGNFQELASYHAKNIIDEYHVLDNGDRAMMKSYLFDSDRSIRRNGIVLRFACDYDGEFNLIQLRLEKKLN